MSRVFVSYSHDSMEHKDAVRELCDALLAQAGLEVVFDGNVAPPDGGWYRWSGRELERAKIVLVVCTATYRRRFEGEEEDPRVGLGVSYEAARLHGMVVRERGYAKKVVCVLLPGASAEDIPGVLMENHRAVYDGSASRLKELVSAIWGVPTYVPPRRAWAPMLATTMVEIVGHEDFSTWVQWNLPALPGRDAKPDELFVEYAQRLIQEVAAAGDDEMEQVLQRLESKAADPVQQQALGRIRALWEAERRASSGVVIAARPVVAEPSGAKTLATTHTAIVLDRTEAWTTLTRTIAAEPSHVAFVVYGTWHQDLQLFTERIEKYFNQEAASPHKLLNVNPGHDGSRATTAEDWGRATIAATESKQPPLRDALFDEAFECPLLLLLSDDGPIRAGDRKEAGALVTFLAKLLPDTLAARPPHNPVRVVVPVELPDSGSTDFVLRIQRELGQSSTLALFDKRLELPDWPDIEKSLLRHAARSKVTLTHGDLDRCKVHYDAIVARASAAERRMLWLANNLHELYSQVIREAKRNQPPPRS